MVEKKRLSRGASRGTKMGVLRGGGSRKKNVCLSGTWKSKKPK